MDKREAQKIAEKYIRIISEKYIVEKAIMFGSYAKGTNHPDSDIDLAIIIKNVKDIIDTQINLLKLRNDDLLFIEPHPFNEGDFNTSDPFASEIIKNGIEINVV